MTTETPLQIWTPTLRWTAKAQSIADIETELARIWATQDLTVESNGETIRRVGARTSVMNLVVVARRPELAEHCAATVQALTGRHPSRTIVIQSADPDGPSWFDARIEAHCVLPRADAAEICAETIHVISGGEAGQHLAAIATPLVIHDLPVTVWWPGEPLLTSPAARELLAGADRLVVDGSAWSGDGLRRIHDLAMLVDTTRLGINDFALVRQARWREAIASTFDDPDFLPYLGSMRRIAITYGTHDDTGAVGSTNLVKPLYHVAWLAARLGLTVETPLAPSPVSARAAKAAPTMSRGLVATLRNGRSEVAVVMRPVASATPAGTTLRVELLAERRGSELRTDITAEADTVRVRVWQDGVEALDRLFRAPRRNEADLLADAIESGRRDAVGVETLRSAAALVGPAGGSR